MWFLINPYQFAAAWPSNWLLTSLVSYWKCDTNGSFPDAHWSNTGTINGATYTASWKINWAYDYDWVNDYISTADIDLWLSWAAFSINIWFKHDESSISSRVLIQKWTSWSNNAIPYSLSIRNSSWLKISLIIWTWSSNFQAFWTTTLTQWQWYMATLVRSGTSYKVFLDWDTVTPDISTTSSLSPYNTADTLNIWRWWAYYKWTIDEVGVWDTALTDEQVESLYNSSSWLSYDSFTT